MNYNFDQVIDRCGSDSVKWHFFDPDVLPMWVADMDFAAPAPVIRALQERVEHGILGYPCHPKELVDVFVERLEQRYGWKVEPEAIMLVPGVVTGFNQACQTFGKPGEGVLMQMPVYHPFLEAPRYAGMVRQENELVYRADGSYEIDFDAFERAITPETRVFILCNPHNPVGRVFHKDELERLADICLRKNVILVSDEIHCDLIYPGHHHIPAASLSPEIERRSITLMAPSKTFNIAGLACSMAIIPDPELRKQYIAGKRGVVGFVNVLGMTAALAAYRDGQEWLDQLLPYLHANRDHLAQRVARDLPGVRMAAPEGTYLAWLDCRDAGLPTEPGEFFTKHGKVGVNEGSEFGKPGTGFVRLNFGCPRSLLDEGIDRMQQALQAARART